MESEELADKLKAAKVEQGGAAKKKESEEGKAQQKDGDEEIGIEEDAESMEAEHGRRKAKKVLDPKLPTAWSTTRAGTCPTGTGAAVPGGGGERGTTTRRARKSSRASPSTAWTTASRATSSARVWRRWWS